MDRSAVQLLLSGHVQTGLANGWNSYRDVVRRHRLQDYGIRAYGSVVTDLHISEDFGTSTYVHMPADLRRFAAFAYTDGDLLKDQAIWAYSGSRMNHDAIGVRKQQPATKLAVQRNIST